MMAASVGSGTSGMSGAQASDFFALAEQRLAWVDRRQALLTQNIANANTPGFTPRDVAPFATHLARAVLPLRTNLRHMTGTAPDPGNSRERPEQRAPDGNAVSLETQLTKIADTEQTQALTLNLYHKYLGMFRIALGR